MLGRCTSFSPSPIHLDMSVEAVMLKKVAAMLLAIARPIMVLPVPGGPNRSRPFAGARAPCDEHSRLKHVTGLGCASPAVGSIVIAKAEHAAAVHMFAATEGTLPVQCGLVHAVAHDI